jgi:NAD(P)-dependent dehydrogenase (short-subunit alcohol dehydrogenase family)
MRAYGNVKRMLTMYTYELADRLMSSRVTANAVMPGFVATNLGRNSGSRRSSIMFALVRPMQISAREGAATSVYVASSDEVTQVTWRCFAKQKETSSCPLPDKAMQKELWNKTIEMLGLPKN